MAYGLRNRLTSDNAEPLNLRPTDPQTVVTKRSESLATATGSYRVSLVCVNYDRPSEGEARLLKAGCSHWTVLF